MSIAKNVKQKVAQRAARNVAQRSARNAVRNAARKERLPKLVFKTLPLVFRVSPALFILEYTATLFDAVLLVLTTISLQNFFEHVTKLAAGETSFNAVLLALIWFALLKMADEAADGVANFLGELYASKSNQVMLNELNRKVDRLDALELEDPEILTQIGQAYRGAYDVRNLIHVVMDIACLYVPYFVFMGLYLWHVEPVLPWILPLVFIPVIVMHMLRSNYYTRLDDLSAPLRRKEEHYKECMTTRPFFKETRALGAGGFFLARYTQTFKRIQQLRYQTELRSQGVEIAANVCSLAGYIAIIGLLIALLMQGRIAISSFAAILAAMYEMFALMTEVFDYRLGELSASMGQIHKYFRFLALPEQRYGQKQISSPKTLTLEKVGFSYPGTTRSALRDISVTINPGETLAIVGENGSGKTTLAKLILGLYRPEQGQILLGGIPLSELAEENAYKNVSCVFQDFQRYQLSLRDNVAISDYAKLAVTDDAAVQEAASAAGFHINQQQMVQGMDTILSKEFGGTDLSRGEWQRLSIARAYYRAYWLIVLDEPTAAIDPFEEDRIYRDFMALKKNCTAIIITHRLGAVRMADCVLVLREGQMTAIGTHEQLLSESRYYRKLWAAQNRYMK
ncbi:MAG TPA: hypothetical protein DCL69_08790 [Firmicutes bacterium]|nr:hypothetical protein [Bacillota bacterium]